MPYISEVSSIFIQRFYTGLITLRNQLVTPVRTMGRRIIELYEALISGNDWEVTPQLTLKRRAGHTSYVGINAPALNLYSWKTNTQGTIPIIDTTADIEYVNNSGISTVITTKTVTSQCGLLGIGNFLYLGNTSTNLKFDGPHGTQGVTNWGISIVSTPTTYGPSTATTGTSGTSSNPAWTNPSNVTGSSGFATVTISPPTNTQSAPLFAGTFSFSVPTGTVISGIQVTFNAAMSDQVAGDALILVGLSLNGSGGYNGTTKIIRPTGTPSLQTLGGLSDLWGNSVITPATVNNASSFSIIFGAFANQVGASVPDTVQINDVIVTIYSGAIISATPTGSGTFSAVNGYVYVLAYGNGISGEISNGSVPTVSTGPFTNVASVDIPVVASTDTQVNQIRIYRTTDTGGGNQFFEISNSPFANTSATIHDTTPDTQLQVTSQAEINLGNTPPPAGLINLEWFSGRMWGSVGNLLYASTGPETLSGTAPQSNWNPLFQWVIPGVIQKLETGPNGMQVQTQDDCLIVRGTDITNYTVNHYVRDFGIRSFNARDTDGTNTYVFTSDRQFISINASGANDIGLPIADQLAQIDPSLCYVKVNRYGLDSIVRVLDTVNNLYYDYNLNQQCWNLPGLLQMPNCTAMGSIETSPGVWQLLLCSNVYDTATPPNFVSATLAYRDITNFQDLGVSYAPVAVFGSIQLAAPGNLAKFGARGGITLEYTSAGLLPTLSVLPNDMGCTLTNAPGAQVTGNFVSLSTGRNPVTDPPTLGTQPVAYRAPRYYWMVGKGISAFVRHMQFMLQAAKENQPTELIGFGIFGDEKSETGAPGKIPELQGR